MATSLNSVALTIVLLVAPAGALPQGAPTTPEAKLGGSTMLVGDQFGDSVSIDGDWALVGAPGRGSGVLLAVGVAYIFSRTGSTWTEQVELAPTVPVHGGIFGNDVALCGSTAAVAAHGSETVHIYVKSGTSWAEEAVIQGVTQISNSSFARCIDLDGDRLVVGIPTQAAVQFGPGLGAAKVYVRTGTTWSLEQTLLASDPGAGDKFGQSVSIDGNTILIGASLDDIAGLSRAGSAYVFTRSGSTWTEQVKLTASDKAADDQFGAAVSLSADQALIGAPRAAYSGFTFAGAVYDFRRAGSAWTEQGKVTPSDPGNFRQFGSAIDQSGINFVVGSPAPTFGAQGAHLFELCGGTWKELDQLQPFPFTGGPQFGWSVAVSGDTTIVGANQEPVGGTPAVGAAYVYRQQSAVASYCISGFSASGCAATLSATGIPSATAGSGFSVTAASIEGGQVGLLFLGFSGQQSTPWGTGSSTMCVAPPRIRAALLPVGGTAGSCDGSYQQDLNALWCTSCPKGMFNPGPGNAVEVQFWYSDPQNPLGPGSSLSDALEFCMGP